MTAAYVVLIRGSLPAANGEPEVIGPFPDGRAMDEWLAEHEDTIDDWLAIRRDFGMRPVMGIADESVAVSPATWLLAFEGNRVL